MSDFCINPGSEDYRELYNIFGNNELVHLLWDRNGGHNLDLNPSGKSSTLFNQLLEFTDNNRGEAIKLKAQFYLDEYTDANGKWYEDFVDEPTLNNTINYKDTRIGALTAFAERLSKKLGYNWMYNPNLKGKTKGQVNTEDYDEPTIEINPFIATIDTPIHEFAHPFIATLQRDNLELYNNLVKEVTSTDIGKEMLTKVERNYSDYTPEAKIHEAIVYTLQAYAEDMIDRNTGLFNVISKVWSYIKDLICDAFGIAKTTSINPNTTIAELAYLILDPTVKLDLGRKLSNYEIQSLYNLGKLEQRQISKHTPEEITKKFTEHANNIISKEVTEKGETDRHFFWKKDDSEERLKGVTTRMRDFAYGPVKKPDKNALPLRVGSTIHKHFENLCNDIIEDLSDKYKVKLTDEAKEDIRNIFKDLKKGSKVLSEVVVADPETGLVGVIDLVVISPEGRIMLYDFKTKIRGKVTEDGRVLLKPSGFIWFNSTRYQVHSDQDVAHLQLSIYAQIIQKSLGLPVSAISVVRLDAITRGSDIVNTKRKTGSEFKANVDKGYEVIESITPYSESESMIEKPFYDEKGRVKLHYDTDRVMYGDAAYVHNRLMEHETKREKESAEEEVFAKVKVSETEAGQLLEKLKAELASRVKLARKRFNIQDRGSLEDLVKQLENEESVTLSLYKIINNAYDEIDRLTKELNDYRNNSKDFSVNILYRWKDAVQSYKSLSELQTALQLNKDLIPDKSYMHLLDTVVTKVNLFEDLYKKEGRRLIAKWLTPYYNGVKVAQEDTRKAEYRRIRHKEIKKNKMSLDDFEKQYGTIEDFVDKGINKTRVEKDTYDLLYKELEVASRDIGELTRWVDNMLDSSDPVASALVNAIVQADEKARLEAIDMKYELVDAVNNLMKVRNKSAFASEEAYYSFMLEHDDKGNSLQALITPIKSSFWADIEKIRKDPEFKLSRSRAETESHVDEFKRQHREYDVEAFREAFIDRVNELLKSKEISISQANVIQQFMEVNYFFRIEDIARIKELELSEDIASKLHYWYNKNRDLFYNWKTTDYINPEWNSFMKLCGIDTKLSLYMQYKALKDSDNPYAKFYTQIEKLNQQANYMIPTGYRLYSRLPGVIKLNSERLKAGQNPLDIARATFDTNMFVRPEDLQRGNKELTNEFGRVKYFIPVYYTAKIDSKDQSYDIPGIYFKFWESANDYRNKRNILPEMEMTRYFVNTRKALKRSVFRDILSTSGNVDDDNEPTYKDTTNLASQLNDWFEMAIYGKFTKDEKALWKLSDKKSVDLMKVVDWLNRYTSMNLLAGNFNQGTANVIIGEVMQAIENIAHEYVRPTTYSKATTLYMSYLPSVMGDVGQDVPTSLPGMIFEEFNVLGDDISETMFSTRTRAGKFARNTSIYFIQHAGEHWLQNRFLIAMLLEKHAYDKNGTDIGNMLDQYEVKNGRLSIKDNVDLVKSKWTDKDRIAFKIKIKGILSRMHGEYGELGRVAIQRVALGRMAYMFRKFVLPGFRRRWGRRVYIERLGQYVEGNYITTLRFFKNYHKDLMSLRFAVMSENWASLSDHEKANIRRTLSEATFVLAAVILAMVFYNMADDDDENEWLASFLAYQFYRLRAELLFFTPKLDEAWSILRSPMASMSVFENVINLSGQIFDPTERYVRGPWKGHLKLEKTTINFIPFYRQFYKIRDVKEQIQWFKN